MNNTKQSLSWDERVSAVATSLNLTPAVVTAKLSEWGIDKDQLGVEALDDDDVTKFGDFVTFFGTGEGGEPVKQAKLRLAFKFLKGGTKADARSGMDPRALELRQKFGFKPTLESASLEQLVSLYDPTKSGDPITAALKKRFEGRRVVAFKPETNTVDVSATLQIMGDVEQGLLTEDVTTTMSEGRLVELQEVGVLPVVVLDEDPLFAGKPLRAGRSIVNHRDWSKVSQEARQFCRLVDDVHHVSGNAMTIITVIKAAESGIAALAEMYPDVDLEFRKRKQEGTLPPLRVTRESRRPDNNPFGIGRGGRTM